MVRRQAEDEGFVAAVNRVVVGNVQNEDAGATAVGVGAEDAQFVAAAGIAVPVADDGLVAGLAEVEGFAGIDDAVVVEVQVFQTLASD